jgi:hypothetical protein
LDPLPPGPIWNGPAKIVSPRRGRRGVRIIMSAM